jgi:hypothetical protein
MNLMPRVFIIGFILLLWGAIFTTPVRAVENEITYNGVNTNLVGDDSYAGPFNLGFTFNYYGVDYTQAYVNINGMLTFGSGNSSYSNGALASSGPNTAIYPFWDDLVTGSGKIYYTSVGEEGSRKFIVQWTNMYFYYNPSLPMGTFQVVLYEGSNNIHLQYRDLLGGASSQGNSATIGIKKDASTYIQYSLNSAVLTEGQAISYIPDGIGSYTQNAGATYDPLYILGADVPAGPQLVNPLNGSENVTTTPVFEWLPVSLATSYRLVISTQANFSSLVINQTGITGTSYTLGSALNFGTLYYWKVEAVNSNGGTFSTSRTFTTADIPNAVPNNPANIVSAVLLGERVNLNKLRTNSVQMDLSDPDVGNQVRYRVQIASDDLFNTIVIDCRSSYADQGAFSYTFGSDNVVYLVGAVDTQLQNGQSYYFKVRAEDDGSASSSYVGPEGVAFIYDNEAPAALASPFLVGQATTIATVIAWDPTEESNPGNPVYSLEIANNDSFTDSDIYNTNDTGYELNGLLQGQYFARVFVNDDAGNISNASPVLEFTIVAPTMAPTPTVELTPTITPTQTPAPTPTPRTTYTNPIQLVVYPETGNEVEEILPTPTPQLKTGIVTEVQIKVIDNNGDPIANAKVILYSSPKIAYTDKNGIAIFKNIELGLHKVVVENGDIKVEKALELNESESVIEAKVVIDQDQPEEQASNLNVTSCLILPIVFVISLIILLVLINIGKSKKTDSDLNKKPPKSFTAYKRIYL